MSYVVADEPVIYPKDDEVELADEHCLNCAHQTFTCSCWDCGGDGGHDGYEEDPLWYDPGEMVICTTCWGKGFHHWCPRCGWDLNLHPKFNTPESRGMALIKT